MKKHLISLMAFTLTATMAFSTTVFAVDIVIESVALQNPTGMAMDEDGIVYIADLDTNQVFTWEDGEMEVFAGVDIQGANSSSNIITMLNGAKEKALFNSPMDVAIYGDGLLVSDTGNHLIRYIEDGSVSTFLGDGDDDYSDSSALKSSFSSPMGIAVDGDDNIYIADSGNGVIRKYVADDAEVITFATGFTYPTALCLTDDGGLLVTDAGTHQIKAVSSTGVVSVFAGTFDTEDGERIGGHVDGSVEKAMFNLPMGILVDGDVVYVADMGNSAVRVIYDGNVMSVLDYDEANNDVLPAEPFGLLQIDNQVYVSDCFSGVLIKVPTGLASYVDVAETDWFYDSVTYLTTAGYMDGSSANDFDPYTIVDRGTVASVIYEFQQGSNRNIILPTGDSFSDVAADSDYATAISWISTAGVASGYGDEFGVNDQITREDFATILYRYAKYNGVVYGTYGDVSAFNDANTFSSYAVEAISWAQDQGIIYGRDSGAFDPKASCSRAEAAAMICRLIEKLY